MSLPGYDANVKSTSARSIAYTIRELGRRAGASSEDIARWRVRINERDVTVYPDPDRAARIRFSFDASKPARLAHLRKLVPVQFEEVVVPFEESATGGPLFAAGDSEELVCRADILTAALWTVSRLEETLDVSRDEHERIRARDSMAGTFAHLTRPIVDEYGLALQTALQRLRRDWAPLRRGLRVKISHDIDLVGLPRRLRMLAGHLYVRRNLRAFVTDVLSPITAKRTAYLQAAIDLHETSQKNGFASAFYWMAATRATAYDSGYDPGTPLVSQTILRLQDSGAEIGIHPGYDTYRADTELERQLSILRTIVGDAPIGGRQHYLRWDPSMWLSWERAGLAYDSSVGYADGVGFRAGTAWPYHPWIVNEDRETELLEIPLIVMDCAPIAYMGLNENDTLSLVRGLVEQCRRVGGVFTLLWHNTSIVEQPYARLYPHVLEMLRGAQQYDWTSERAPAPLPQIVESTVAR